MGALIDAQWEHVPEGYVVVPIKPTDTMIEAARGNAIFDAQIGRIWRKGLLANWGVMIAAATDEAPRRPPKAD